MVKIGKILKKKGFDNEILISLNLQKHTEVTIKELPFLFVELLPGSRIPYRLNEITHYKDDKYHVIFDRVELEHHVESLLGKNLYLTKDTQEDFIPKDALLETIIGYELWDDTEIIGLIEDFYELEPQPLLVIQKDEQELLIPFVEDWIISFDPSKKQLNMDLPDGLLDLEE